MSDSFNWYTYLSETGAELAPAHLFRHVERSSEPSFLVGHTMEVELAVLTEIKNMLPQSKACWPCEVLLSNEKTVYLRWCYPPDLRTEQPSNKPTSLVASFFQCFPANFSPEELIQSSPFWLSFSDTVWNRIHPIGWAESNDVPWMPPCKSSLSTSNPDALSKSTKWLQTEWGKSLARRSVPRIFFEKKASSFHQFLQTKGYLECQLTNNPTCVWPVKVSSILQAFSLSRS